MILDKIKFHNGIVTYNSFDIDLSKSPEEQELELNEDLIQISYQNRYTIDVGWYPSLEPTGFFRIFVIEDFDWDEPLFELKVKSFDNFIESLQKAIDFTAQFIEENPNRPYRPTWHYFNGLSEGK